MQYEYANSPVWANADQTAVNLNVKFNDIAQEIPFTGSETDPTAHGQQLYADAVAGEFGAIGAYVPSAPTPEQVKQSILAQTQKRLDTFARTRNYDGILSLATYAGSSVPKFAAEGQYGVQARDETWAALYIYESQVAAGALPPPTSFADVQPFLPVLAWPIP